jgi:hypothetical protein
MEPKNVMLVASNLHSIPPIHLGYLILNHRSYVIYNGELVITQFLQYLHVL